MKNMKEVTRQITLVYNNLDLKTDFDSLCKNTLKDLFTESFPEAIILKLAAVIERSPLVFQDKYNIHVTVLLDREVTIDLSELSALSVEIEDKVYAPGISRLREVYFYDSNNEV